MWIQIDRLELAGEASPWRRRVQLNEEAEEPYCQLSLEEETC